MCGIIGIVSPKPVIDLEQKVRAGAKVLNHRGPEDEGYWKDPQQSIALGHKRLCIIDLHHRSAQPFRYLDRYTIVYNGELYNYLELKSTLQQKGYSFTTASDTEVLVAAYAAYGKDCVQHFDGMFSFAIWDEQEKMMYAARDRFGEKPFYYSFDDGQLIFASEMKALWEAGVAKEPNNSMLYNYITLGYTTNPFDSNETFYTKVQKLPAASFLTYSLASQQLVIEKYWQVDSIEKEGLRDEDVVHAFNERLSSSIQKRLRSDVAIGTSLSGGLDSSAIVGFCSRITNEQYVHQCFTAVFPGYEKSEEQYASIVAKQFHLQHHLVQVTEEDLAGNMDALMWHHEEPVGSSSILAQYKVYEAAKQNGITVLLDGQGADELLAGYHKYYKWYWQQLYAERRLKSSGELAAAHSLGIKESFGLKNKAMALLPHFSMAMLQSKKAKEAFKHPDLNKEFAFLQKRNSYYTTPTESTLNSALFYNSFVNGLEELLRYADRNSMAHSVEVRLPFLQHQLVEFLFSLPPHFKIRNGWTKWLLRKATEQTLPSSIVWRKDKVGFEPPQKQWMLHHKVQEHIQASKELLVKNDILSAAVLSKPIKPSDAGDAINSDWRYWSASYLFR